MSMQKTAVGRVLLFHVNILKQGSIRALCDDLGLAARVIGEQDLSRTIGEIAGLSGSSGHCVTGNNPVPFTDEMMVFCAMDPDLLDRFLAEYRSRGISAIGLKAVLTPYNAKWTPGRLCMELKKEQQSINSNSKKTG